MGDTTVVLRYQNLTSSYTAELQAIFSCLEHILATTHSLSPSPFLINSDSLAAILDIAQPTSSHPLVTRIHSLLTTSTATSIPVILFGPPSQKSIQLPNKRCSFHPYDPHSFLLPDLFPFINKFIYLSWFDLWGSQHSNILARIKHSSLLWYSSNLPSCSHEITITRRRIGHTRLTYTHLLTHLMPLSCPH